MANRFERFLIAVGALWILGGIGFSCVARFVTDQTEFQGITTTFLIILPGVLPIWLSLVVRWRREDAEWEEAAAGLAAQRDEED